MGGKIGVDLTVEDGYQANRFVGLTMLRTLKDELGSLERVERPLFQTNYVNVGAGLGETFVRGRGWKYRPMDAAVGRSGRMLRVG